MQLLIYRGNCPIAGIKNGTGRLSFALVLSFVRTSVLLVLVNPVTPPPAVNSSRKMPPGKSTSSANVVIIKSSSLLGLPTARPLDPPL
jgi:hypothetical protein